jgi:hypothetical protein
VEKIRDCVSLRGRQSPAVARYLLEAHHARSAPQKPPGS